MKINLNTCLGLTLALILLPACTGKQAEKEIVGKVNDRLITLQEFRLFYELDPNFAIDSTGPGALHDELDKYIDQILAYDHAEQMGLLNDSIYIKGCTWELHQAMLRELYRQQVQNQITVDDQDLRAEFLKSAIQVHVRQLFSKDLNQAERWYAQLTQGGSFQALAREAFHDTTLAANGGDLGWVTLNSLDDDFWGAIINMQKNEISRPVHTRWGYHIIQLLDRRDQVILPEEEFQHQRPMLEKKIRQRKGRQFANQYISHFIGKFNPQPDPATLRFLWQQVVPKDEQEKKVLSRIVELNEKQIQSIQQNYRGYLDKPLVNFKKGHFTLAEFLHGVVQMPYSNRPRFKSIEQFSNQLGTWVRDELLLREAERRNLDREPRVQAEVRSIMEQNFYNLFVEQEVSALSVPDSVQVYFNSLREQAGKNKTLARFHNLEDWRWDAAEKSVHHNLRLRPVQIWIDRDKIQQESRNINWDRPIRMFMVRR
jgi:parvulin-like peptidyl-prolyl isomerase